MSCLDLISNAIEKIAKEEKPSHSKHLLTGAALGALGGATSGAILDRSQGLHVLGLLGLAPFALANRSALLGGLGGAVVGAGIGHLAYKKKTQGQPEVN
jgi:hypothetical protein